jgi:hypothetical protein
VYAIDATDFCVRLMPSILLTSLNMRRGNLLYNDDTTKIPLVAQSQCTLSNKISVGCRMVIIPRVLGWLENNFCIKHPCFLHIVYVYMLGCIKIFVSTKNHGCSTEYPRTTVSPPREILLQGILLQLPVHGFQGIVCDSVMCKVKSSCPRLTFHRTRAMARVFRPGPSASRI